MGTYFSANTAAPSQTLVAIEGLSIMRGLFLLALSFASGQATSRREAMQQMDLEKFNNDAMCWGLENMMAFRLARRKAMEECGRSVLASGLVKPTTLPGNLNNNNPFAQQQNPLNRLFNKANNKSARLPSQ